MEKTIITVTTTVEAPIEKVWQCWTTPEHIKGWNHANDEWHTPHATNDIRPGGNFLWRMEAKDGSFGFDFGGTYEVVNKNKLIEYIIGDGRKVIITFTSSGNKTEITENFEAESLNAVDLQKAGWQAILNNFKKYTENLD